MIMQIASSSHSALLSSSLRIMFSPFFFSSPKAKKRSTHHENHSVTSFFINIMENETPTFFAEQQGSKIFLGGFLELDKALDGINLLEEESQGLSSTSRSATKNGVARVGGIKKYY